VLPSEPVAVPTALFAAPTAELRVPVSVDVRPPARPGPLFAGDPPDGEGLAAEGLDPLALLLLLAPPLSPAPPPPDVLPVLLPGWLEFCPVCPEIPPLPLPPEAAPWLGEVPAPDPDGVPDDSPVRTPAAPEPAPGPADKGALPLTAETVDELVCGCGCLSSKCVTQ
jgi:hypothetical protein